MGKVREIEEFSSRKTQKPGIYSKVSEKYFAKKGDKVL